METPQKEALCILNPVAGKRNSTQSVIKSICGGLEPEYRVSFYVTQKKGDAAALVREHASRASVLVCCGGDGTLNEVVTGLRQAECDIPICYLARGTTNDIARTLRLPRDTENALRLVAAGTTVPQDIGILNGTAYFTYLAAFGAFTEVSYNTPQSSKKRFGYAAYLFYSLKGLRRIRSYHAIVEADGQRTEGEYIFGSISNSFSIGGAVRLDGPGIRLDDGRLELLLVRKTKNWLEFLRVLFRLMRGNTDDPAVFFRSVSHLSVAFDDGAPWTIDGEYAGLHDHISIGVSQNAIRLFIPASKS